MPRLTAAALVLALAVATPTLALAQGAPDDTARADALFEEGRALSAKGDLAAACAKFEESQKIRPGIGTLFNLADCHEKQGNVVLAYNEYVEVAERTKVALQADREKVARERIAQLEPKIGRIVLETPAIPGDLVIQIDGVDIPADAWRRPIGVPPGEHVVKYGKRGGELKELKVDAPAGKTPVVVDISRELVPAEKPAEKGPPPPQGERNVPLIAGATALMGVGLISLGISGYVADRDKSRTGVIAATGLGGLACIGVGIPLLVIGLKRRPVEAEPAARAWSPEEPPPAGAFVRPEVASANATIPWNGVEAGPVPAVVVGAGSATAGWRF